MTDMLKNVCTVVLSAANIMSDTDFSVEVKGEKENLLTTNDKRIQEFLYKELKNLIPTSGFLGEENVTEFQDSEYVWIVDPIDGTTNYIRGIRDCAISVALECRGELIIGVVYSPFTDELFAAEKDGGAFLNGRPIHVSDKPFGKGLLCTAFSVYKKALAETCINVVRDIYAECSDFRRFGSAAMELCYLADGRCDLYFEIRVFPWDFAGAAVILREAGGYISGLDGSSPPLRRTTPLIAANSKENLERLLHHTRKHIKEIPYSE